jgi:hypothetical protein
MAEMISLDDRDRLVAKLFALVGRRFTQERKEVYSRALQDLPLESLERSVNHLLLTWSEREVPLPAVVREVSGVHRELSTHGYHGVSAHRTELPSDIDASGRIIEAERQRYHDYVARRMIRQGYEPPPWTQPGWQDNRSHTPNPAPQENLTNCHQCGRHFDLGSTTCPKCTVPRGTDKPSPRNRP